MNYGTAATCCTVWAAAAYVKGGMEMEPVVFGSAWFLLGLLLWWNDKQAKAHKEIT